MTFNQAKEGLEAIKLGSVEWHLWSLTHLGNKSKGVSVSAAIFTILFKNPKLIHWSTQVRTMICRNDANGCTLSRCLLAAKPCRSPLALFAS